MCFMGDGDEAMADNNKLALAIMVSRSMVSAIVSCESIDPPIQKLEISLTLNHGRNPPRKWW